jgi:hypothetical protein
MIITVDLLMVDPPVINPGVMSLLVFASLLSPAPTTIVARLPLVLVETIANLLSLASAVPLVIPVVLLMEERDLDK